MKKLTQEQITEAKTTAKSHAMYLFVKAPLGIVSAAMLLAYAGGALRDNIVQPKVDALYYGARLAAKNAFNLHDMTVKPFEITQSELDKLDKQNACVVALKAASRLEDVPITILASTLMTENAQLNPKAKAKNDNGTYDFGCAQINTINIGLLFEKESDAFGPFLNLMAAAKFLKMKKDECGGDWHKAQLCYHSKTPDKAATYQTKINKSVAKYVPNAPLNKADTSKLAMKTAQPVKAKQPQILVADASYSDKEREKLDNLIEKEGK